MQTKTLHRTPLKKAVQNGMVHLAAANFEILICNCAVVHFRMPGKEHSSANPAAPIKFAQQTTADGRKTYLNWTRQNLRYCAERKTGEVSAISSELVSNFLAYLAMQRKVSPPLSLDIHSRLAIISLDKALVRGRHDAGLLVSQINLIFLVRPRNG